MQLNWSWYSNGMVETAFDCSNVKEFRAYGVLKTKRCLNDLGFPYTKKMIEGINTKTEFQTIDDMLQD